jgi:hypothetical protein
MTEVLRQKVAPAVWPFISKILREHYRDLQKGTAAVKPRRFPPPLFEQAACFYGASPSTSGHILKF